MNCLTIRALCLSLIACVSSSREITAEELVVETEFEGGSARVMEVDSDKRFIRIMPGGDPERGWPAWWCCRVTGLTTGQLLKLSVVPSSSFLPVGHPGAGKPLSAGWALPDRAAWSTDGRNWQQTSTGERSEIGMTYELTADDQQLWVAWGPLATPSITETWLADAAASHDFVSTFELTQTREGRRVRGVRIASGDMSLDARPVVWLHARQHAWESGSSWVARGIIDWLLSDATNAVWLRSNALVYVVPIMDVDRVSTGDGGKEANPHDHNRDWSDTPHYPEVAAVQARIKKWAAENRMAVFVDLHNPGPNDKKAYFYVAPDEAIEDSQRPPRSRFLDTIEAAWHAPIPFDRNTRSTGPDYHPLWRQISSTWVTQHSNHDSVSVCLETPWNTPYSTTEGYGSVGASLAEGISLYLQSEQNQ